MDRRGVIKNVLRLAFVSGISVGVIILNKSGKLASCRVEGTDIGKLKADACSKCPVKSCKDRIDISQKLRGSYDG